MLQHVGKVGALLVSCVAEERRELAIMAPQSMAEAPMATTAAARLARDVPGEMQRAALGPLAAAALAEECQADGGDTGDWHPGAVP